MQPNNDLDDEADVYDGDPAYELDDNHSRDELVEALLHEDPADVQALLDEEADPNRRLSEDGGTPLMVAARLGEASLVEQLLARGADLHAKDDEHWTALHWAASEGRDQAVAVLLHAGALVDTPDAAGNTPLLLAAEADHAAAVRVLIEQGGADVNAINRDNLSAVTLAAMNGHTNVLEILLATGAHLDLSDEHSRVALTYAARRGHISWGTLHESERHAENLPRTEQHE
jgi:hypothetical protein